MYHACMGIPRKFQVLAISIMCDIEIYIVPVFGNGHKRMEANMIQHYNRIFICAVCAVLLTGTFACSSTTGQAPRVCKAQVDATNCLEPVSPYIYGQFIEHLGRCIYGGIWAEMLEDRKFYFPVDGKQSGWGMHEGKNTSWEGDGMPYEILVASPWQILGLPDHVTMDTTAPYVGAHGPVISLDASEARGIFHPRLGLQTGHRYVGYLVAKATGTVTRLEVSLQWGERDDAENIVALTPPGQDFAKIPFEFMAGGDADDGRLAVRAAGTGQLHIGTVSLMPADNVEGFRQDTLALLRELNAPVYRWPGGNFVSGYDWRDGIGDRDRRPPRKNPAWTGIEPNDVGIHEFMRFCELLGTEPYVALNTGQGDVNSAAQEVAYITGAQDTPEGAKRAANGHPEPWKVAFWAVGNEMYGDWQLGHMPLEDYVKKHNAVVEAIRAVSPEARCVGVGAAGKWSETMLSQCADHMELISEHLYWQRKEDVSDHVRQAVDQIEGLAEKHREYRASLPGLKDKDIRIALDEWNYWYGPHLYGELGTRYFVRDGLGCAAALHAMFRNSDLFFMANYAQTVNVIGAIKTTRTTAFLETTGQVLKLYRQHFGSIPVTVKEDMDGLDVSAAWTQDKSAFTLAAVNTTDKALTVSLDMNGITLPENAVGWVIQNDDPEAYNDETHQENVVIRETTVPLNSGNLALSPYSITLISMPVNQK